ncbi:MAG: hypothetical protein EAZ44_03530 [Cytophagia bacterium]|nr:MAG: hypothetical protein EAY69_08010 [Cytophagales bacterium]TAG05282.1 MAG: hypothetical protein EAZ44_03530 [Cytophagia bacterium]TAG42499.1 MAG: hypothetical protein EAZ31_05960 [Cytophagia bacterium]TAH28699.1 MAG: hypothetical protein EAZ06_09120 [Cytophagales bacterium]
MKDEYWGLIYMTIGAIIIYLGLQAYATLALIVGVFTFFRGFLLNDDLISQIKGIFQKKSSTNNIAITPKFELTDELIIKLANRLNGKLTADELSQQTSLSLEEAKNRLEKLLKNGRCEINLDEINQQGKIFYYF